MEHSQATVAVLMLCICVLLGIPVWWNTTKVYRASLPHTKIDDLSHTDIKLSIRVNIFGDIDSADQVKDVLEMKQSLYVFEFIRSERFFNKSGNDAKQACSMLVAFAKDDQLSINLLLLGNQKEDFLYYCEPELSFIVSSKTKQFSGPLSSLFSSFLPKNENKVSQRNVNIGKSLPLSSGYNLVFTLAIAEPNGDLPTWDIENSINHQLNPFLERLNFLGPFHVSSQVLYYTDVGIEPNGFSDGNSSYHFYSKSKIPLIINPLESRLNTYTSVDSGLNFIIYVPPTRYTPLYIKTKKTSTKLNTAFHSPRWGGIQIYNPTDVMSLDVSTEAFMETFMMQFQLLNGLDATETAKLFPKNKKLLLTKSMETRILISKVFENLKTSISTLSSLSKLLDNIANIVIRDDIKDLIDVAVVNIESSIRYLAEGKINRAMDTSKIAFSNSEKAFFDQSLLALLYFPDDQKYAIYVPLFLPISLPILLSFFSAVKYFRKKEKLD